MSKLLKERNEILTVQLLESLKEKYVLIPLNKHMLFDEENDEYKNVNVWFGGKVAGYIQYKNYYDFTEDVFYDLPIVNFDLILTDGKAYSLSNMDCEIYEVEPEKLDILIDRYGEMTKDQKDKVMWEYGKDF